MERAGRGLPSGIVTFVFTDIEGSTRLIKRLGHRSAALLDRHEALLREAFETRGGVVVGTKGDSLFVAFARTADAIDACVHAQEALSRESWPADGVIRVRMGVHAGLASPRHGDYVALAVNQCARVMAAAHGGQVLISEEAASRGPTDNGASMVSVGRFRLRDFDEPVRLFQLRVPGLEESFPAVRAVPAEGHNLVRPRNSFVGRSEELARLEELLEAGRLVSVVGPGGVGKTRLAAEAGVAVAGSWPDGVWQVDLATIETPELVADAVATSIGIPAAGGDRVQEIVDHLQARRALIVLDNAETQIERCAHLVGALLDSCPLLAVMTTSREPLSVAGESVVRLGPLPVPRSKENLAVAVTYPAVELFLDRAHAVRAAGTIEEATVAAVVGICQRLDGLPLALEIAAARTSLLEPSEILSGLDDMFRVLRSRDRSLPARQRTMQALLDWSHRLLELDEQIVFRRLAVFGGAFTLEAATAAVWDKSLVSDDVAEHVWSLADKSLLAVDPSANGTRYRLLEMVREYGRRRLDDARETADVATRLAHWFLERLAPWRAVDSAWISDLAIDLDNVRSLVPLVAPYDVDTAQQLACSIGRYWDTAAQSYRMGIEEVDRLAQELVTGTPARVALLTTLADLHLRVGDVDSARRVLSEASAVRSETGPASWDDAGVERTTGEIAIRSGDHAHAAAIATSALDGDLSSRGRARMWNLLGIARYGSGDLTGAFTAFEHELAEHQSERHEVFVAGAEGNLGEVALQLGDLGAAARHQGACLELALALGMPVMVAYSLSVAGRLARAAGEWSTAVQLQSKATAMLSETGQRLYEEDRREADRLMEEAANVLTQDVVERLMRDAQELDPAIAVELAHGVLGAYGEKTVGAGDELLSREGTDERRQG